MKSRVLCLCLALLLLPYVAQGAASRHTARSHDPSSIEALLGWVADAWSWLRGEHPPASRPPSANRAQALPVNTGSCIDPNGAPVLCPGE